MPVRSPHPTRAVRASQALRRADEVRRVHHRHEAKRQVKSNYPYAALEETHGYSPGLGRDLRLAAAAAAAAAAAQPAAASFAQTANSKSPAGACSLTNAAKALAFGILLYFAFHGVANHAAGAGFDVSSSVFGAHVSRVDGSAGNAKVSGDYTPRQPVHPAPINGSISVKPDIDQGGVGLHQRSKKPLLLPKDGKLIKLLPRIDWNEPPPSFASVALLEMFRMCAFDGLPADAWDPSQSFIFHGKQQSASDASAGDGVDAAALTPNEGQPLGYVSLQGAPLDLYGLPRDMLIQRAKAASAPDTNPHLPLASAASSIDPHGRFDLVLRALVAAGMSPRSGNLVLHHWAAHEGSPEIMNPTRDSDPLVTMRVARSLAELPALVPGLVSPSHWLQFNHPLPYDNSLALLLVQDDIRSLPEAWAYAMGACFDMLWVTSLAAKDELVQARVPPNRVQVVSPVVNTKAFLGLQHRFRFATFKKHVFLVVVSEGRFHDQGLDLAIDAFVAEFSSMDNVALAVVVEPVHVQFRSHRAESILGKTAAKGQKDDGALVDWLLPTGDNAALLQHNKTQSGKPAKRQVPVSYFRASADQCAATFGCAPIVDPGQCARAVAADPTFRNSVVRLSTMSARPTPNGLRKSGIRTWPDGSEPSSDCGSDLADDIVRCVRNSIHYPIGCSVKLPVTQLESKQLRDARFVENSVTLNLPNESTLSPNSSTFSVAASISAAYEVTHAASQLASSWRPATKVAMDMVSAAGRCTIPGDELSADQGGHVCLCQCTLPSYATEFLDPSADRVLGDAHGQKSVSTHTKPTKSAQRDPDEVARERIVARVHDLIEEAGRRKSASKNTRTGSFATVTLPQVVVKVSTEPHTAANLGQFYRAASALLSTPRSITNVESTVALECAAGAGLPVVGFRTPALSDLLDSGASDFLIHPTSQPSAHLRVPHHLDNGVRVQHLQSQESEPTLEQETWDYQESFGWRLQMQDPWSLRGGQRPGAQGYVVGLPHDSNRSTKAASFVTVGGAMRALLAKLPEATRQAADVQRVLAPILSIEGAGGLMRQRLNELMTLSRRQNFQPRRKQFREFCFSLREGRGAEGGATLSRSNLPPLWNLTRDGLEGMVGNTDDANTDLLKTWKFGLHDWAESASNDLVNDFSKMKMLAAKHLDLLAHDHVGAASATIDHPTLPKCEYSHDVEPWLLVDDNRFSFFCRQVNGTSRSKGIEGTSDNNAWALSIVDRCQAKFTMKPIGNTQEQANDFEADLAGDSSEKPSQAGDFAPSVHEATSGDTNGVGGVVGEVKRLEDRFKSQRESLQQHRQQELAAELAHELQVQEFPDLHDPVVQVKFGLGEGVQPILSGSPPQEALAKESIKPFCRGSNEGPHASLHDAERSRLIPSFLLLGPPKSGIRSMFHNIMTHRQMEEPKCREINFFADVDMFKNGLDFYRRFFPWSSPGVHSGEGSLQYFSKPNAPRRIHNVLPDMRLIYVLRDPAKRFISRWLQPLERGEWDEVQRFEDAHQMSYDCTNVFQKFKTRTEKCISGAVASGTLDRSITEEQIEDECMISTKSHLTQGLYYFPLKAWFEEIPNPKQHLLLQLEWIDEHPIEAMQTVAGHLGIFPFSESELRDLVRVGTDRYKHQQEILDIIGNEYSKCDEDELQSFFAPYNLRLRKQLETFLGADDRSQLADRWTYW